MKESPVTDSMQREPSSVVPTESSPPGMPALSVMSSQTLSETSTGGGRDSLEADPSDVAHHKGRLQKRDGTTGRCYYQVFAPLSCSAVLHRRAGLQALKLALCKTRTLAVVCSVRHEWQLQCRLVCRLSGTGSQATATLARVHGSGQHMGPERGRMTVQLTLLYLTYQPCSGDDQLLSLQLPH